MDAAKSKPLVTTRRHRPVSFSKAERLILMNQYRILELLDPSSAPKYLKLSTLLEEGFESRIVYVGQELPELFPELECKFVQECLEMYGAIQVAYRLLESPQKVG